MMTSWRALNPLNRRAAAPPVRRPPSQGFDIRSNRQAATRGLAQEEQIALGKIAQPLRAALSGATVSPGIFDIMVVLGREETLGRLDDVLEGP